MDEPRQVALDMIAAHGDDLVAVLNDHALDEALAPFRRDRPTLLRCGRPGCRDSIMQIAIDLYTPRVLGTPHGRQADELAEKQRRRDDLPESRVNAQLPPLYQGWSLQATGGYEFGETLPEDEHLHPHDRLRRIVTCRKLKCSTRFLVDNSLLLALLVAVDGDEIVLPESLALPETQSRSEPPNAVE